MKKKILIMMTIIWILFIFFNSLQTGLTSATSSGRIVSVVFNFFNWLGIEIQIGVLSLWIRKIAHVFEYFVLAILVTLIIYGVEIAPKYKYTYSLVIPLLIAIIDEFIQTLVPGRYGSIIDVLIDMIGVVIGIGLVSLIRIRRYRIK